MLLLRCSIRSAQGARVRAEGEGSVERSRLDGAKGLYRLDNLGQRSRRRENAGSGETCTALAAGKRPHIPAKPALTLILWQTGVVAPVEFTGRRVIIERPR